jgi:DNA gyrase subunit A
VLNNLYKHTALQDNFSCNMIALVDGVPRTLSLDGFVRHWITHQIEVIVRRTRYRLRKAQDRAHILLGYLKALDALDDVIALIRASDTVDEARTGLMELLDVDELQATAILDMQLRRLAALERQKILDEYDDLQAKIADYNDILSNEPRQRTIVSEELAEITAKYADVRRSILVPWDGEVTDEDLIAEEDVVVTITHGGYAKRTRTDLYRAQRRGGKGVRGAALRADDVVEHFFVTTTHHYLLFFTNKGRVYRAKAYELPDTGRDARGQHVANLLAFQPEEKIAQVLDIRDYGRAAYLVLATRDGMVKKTRLDEFDSNRSGGVIAINLRDDDELISAQLVDEGDDVILVSRKGMSVRFTADDATLRPMGRATSGVIGMRFRAGDQLLAMDAIVPGSYVVTVTDGGYAKRTPVDDWTPKGRGIYGVRAMKLVEERGSLVGAVVAAEDDEVYAIAADGVVIRTRVSEIRSTGRDTMGVSLMDVSGDNVIVAVARAEATDDEGDDDLEPGTEPAPDEAGATAEATAPQVDANAVSTGPEGSTPPGSVTVSDDGSRPESDTDRGATPGSEG